MKVDELDRLANQLLPFILRKSSQAATQVLYVSRGSGSGGGEGGVTDHGLLSGLPDDDHLQYLTNERGDARYMPLTASITAGAGLTSSGALSTGLTLNVGAGAGLTVNADDVALAASVAGAALSYTAGVLAVVPGEGLEIETDAIGLAASVAGAALSYTAGVLAVVPGEGLEIETDAIGLKATVAGAGLTYAAGVVAVGQGAGLTVSADDVALTTPGTLTVTSANSATGSHTHAVTSSNDPGQTRSLLATGTNGEITLRNVFFGQAAQSSATFASGFAGSGWRTDYGITTTGKASAEFDDLTVRGRMRVYELLIQQIRATNGSVFVSSASKVVSVTTATNPAWTVNGAQLTFNGAAATLSTTIYQIATAVAGDNDTGNDRRLYHGFLVGDLIRSQEVRWNGSSYDTVRVSNLEVTGVTDLYNYQATLVSGSAPAVGSDYVRLGNSRDTARQGAVYLTADDAAAPFIDIVDGVASHADWNTPGKIKVRVGKLTGISDSDFGGTLAGYGLYGNNVYLKGQMVVTGGSLGGLAAADVNANTTTIDGGKITANSITALQIAAGTITTTLLNFAPVLEGNVVAKLNASAEGLKIAANLIRIDGTTTFSAGYDPTGKVASGGAAADINANVTTISGGKITTNSIAADKLNVTDLSAIGATIGGWGITSSQINSTNVALYSGASARMEVGTASATAGLAASNSTSGYVMWAGATYANRATAPYRLTLGGSLTSSDATFGNPSGARVNVDGTGLFIPAPSEWSLSYGYKFTYGGYTPSGLTVNYTAGNFASMALWNNTTNDAVGATIANLDTNIYIKNAATGSGRTSTIDLAAHQINGAGVASMRLQSTSSIRRAVFTVDVADGLMVTNYKVWHEGNDGYTSGLVAEDSAKLGGTAAASYALSSALASYAPLANPAFTGTPTFDTMQINNNAGSTGRRYIDIGRWRNVTNYTDNDGIGIPPAKYVRLFVYEDSTGKLRLAISWPGALRNVTDIIAQP